MRTDTRRNALSDKQRQGRTVERSFGSMAVIAQGVRQRVTTVANVCCSAAGRGFDSRWRRLTILGDSEMNAYAHDVIKKITFAIYCGVDAVDGWELVSEDRLELEDLLDKVLEAAEIFRSRAEEIKDSIEYDENGVIK